MGKKKALDLDKPRNYSDPHPGRLGATTPIPEAIRIIAEDLNGRTLPLGEALRLLRAVDAGEVWAVEEYGYIALNVQRGGARHHFRVIRYK